MVLRFLICMHKGLVEDILDISHLELLLHHLKITILLLVLEITIVIRDRVALKQVLTL